jgi:serine/threonine-protein kinase
MSTATTILLALSTSAITAVAAGFIIVKAELFHSPIEQSVVPDLQGLDEDGARQSLNTAKLVMLRGAAEVTSEIKPGGVVRQSVPAGSRLPAGQTVQVSFAEQPPEVPSVEGMTTEEARAKIEAMGFKLVVGEPAFDEKVPRGTVLRQSPAGRATLAKGKSVVVTPSAGVGEVEVPNLAGQPASEVQEELRKLGLEPEVRWVDRAETHSGVVLSQDPQAGQMLAVGGKVQITVNRK